jgi:hypothetical protein
VEFFPATRQYEFGAECIEDLRRGVEIAERGDLGCDGPPRSVQVQGVGGQDNFELDVSISLASLILID